jgi:RND family efflux transporter MFP subunit
MKQPNLLKLLKPVMVLMVALGPAAHASDSIPDDALDCLIEPWVVSDVGSPVQGVIAKLLVDRGQHVEKDQPLAQLESGVEYSDVALAEIRADTESELVARVAEKKLAKLALERMEDMNKQKLVSAQELDESKARYQIASAALTLALENQKIQKLELKRSQRQYARRILTSPIDGVVVEQLAFMGEFVYDNPVMTIAALNPLRVEVMMPARLFGTISKGDLARLHPEIESDRKLFATVDVVDPLLDSRSGTFGVRLLLANPDYKIPAGQRCRISFEPVIAAANADSAGSIAPRTKESNGD